MTVVLRVASLQFPFSFFWHLGTWISLTRAFKNKQTNKQTTFIKLNSWDWILEDGLCWVCFNYLPWTVTWGQVSFSALQALCIGSAPAAAAAKSLQSCSTLCDPTDGSPPGSPDSGILQARTLEWVAISFSRGSSWPRVQTHVSCIVDGFFTAEPRTKAQTHLPVHRVFSQICL